MARSPRSLGALLTLAWACAARRAPPAAADDLSSKELVAIAQADMDALALSLSDSGAHAGAWLANKSERFRWHAPIDGSPLGLDAARRLLGPGSTLARLFTRTTITPVQLYAGFNSVAYVAETFHECANGVVADNLVLVNLRVDPDSRRVLECDEAFFADRFWRMAALCAGEEQLVIERAQTSFLREAAAVAGMDKLWNGLPRADGTVLAPNVSFCVSAQPEEACAGSREEVLAYPSAFATERTSSLTTRTVYSPGVAWLSWADSGVCFDGSVSHVRGEIVYEIEQETGSVVRVTEIVDRRALEGSCLLLNAPPGGSAASAGAAADAAHRAEAGSGHAAHRRSSSVAPGPSAHTLLALRAVRETPSAEAVRRRSTERALVAFVACAAVATTVLAVFALLAVLARWRWAAHADGQDDPGGGVADLVPGARLDGRWGDEAARDAAVGGAAYRVRMPGASVLRQRELWSVDERAAALDGGGASDAAQRTQPLLQRPDPPDRRSCQ